MDKKSVVFWRIIIFWDIGLLVNKGNLLNGRKVTRFIKVFAFYTTKKECRHDALALEIQNHFKGELTVKMNLTMKMLAYFLLVVMTAAAGFAYTIWKVDDTARMVAQVNNEDLPRLLKTSQINKNAADQVAILRGYYITKDPQMLTDYKKAADANEKIELDLINSARSSGARQLASEIKSLEDKYQEIAEKKFIPLVQAGKQEEMQQVMRQELVPAAKALVDKLNEAQEFRNKIINEAMQEATSNAHHAKTVAVGAALSAALLGMVIGFFAARSIARPVNQLAAVAQKVADGDLTEQVMVDRQDEIGQLAAAFNTMVTQLKSLIKQINANAEQVAASSEELTASSEQSAQAANQIATSITDVAHGATEQLTAANETSAVVEQMSAGIQQVAANTNNVAEQSAQAAEKAKDGGQAVEKAVSQMKNIETTAQTVAEAVAKLGEQSKEIGQIVGTIAGIAGQTNLLALNAAIEAARAGEQGRGFAVVAEEVRKLAEESQNAAKQIADLVHTIQNDTDKAVTAMDAGAREVRLGTEVVTGAGAAFREIVALISQVSSQVREISAAIQQMASGSQQIVGSVRRIDTLSKASAGEAQSVSAATEEQLASMEEIATSSQALAKLAQDLQQAVARFRV
jgi:methyl-accepting chemotaxis protein